MKFIRNHKIAIVLLVFLFTLTNQVVAQEQRTNLTMEIDTTDVQIKSLTNKLCAGKSSNLEKAKALLNFTSNTLKWLPTDYKNRSAKEILARGGGNCFELAKVYMHLIDIVDIKYRPIAEINIHPISENRQRTASNLVNSKGNRMSVFGKQHNDHRWVEVYDEAADNWIPVDPSMNVFGVTEWLKARVWFGSRVTIDTTITNDMLVPFTVFVNNNSQKKPWESRSKHYLIIEFNKLYNNELTSLPSWKTWVSLINKIDTPAKRAFTNKENLHNHSEDIEAIENTYRKLKAEYKNK